MPHAKAKSNLNPFIQKHLHDNGPKNVPQYQERQKEIVSTLTQPTLPPTASPFISVLEETEPGPLQHSPPPLGRLFKRSTCQSHYRGFSLRTIGLQRERGGERGFALMWERRSVFLAKLGQREQTNALRALRTKLQWIDLSAPERVCWHRELCYLLHSLAAIN
ncbi:hypothetical protein CEXT_129861 [Caerostris extrusa]|uniref:Uncharacterized protein n=1 Tax=Caerostris extrusa TaxID=172846 RepID=A0AAV4P0L9_CAEEX|nr:hypothetical protein CEXT_129861 [Caerostris extrusa]